MNGTKKCNSCGKQFVHRGDQSCPKCGSLDIVLLPTEGELLRANLNKRERKAQQLLAHYATCERLARYLGTTQIPDGKRISVQLWKAEQVAAKAALAYCNGDIEQKDVAAEGRATDLVLEALGKLPPGFFVNGDPRGYALKIDNENPEGKALIDAVKLHKDWGGYGILSPEITGDR